MKARNKENISLNSTYIFEECRPDPIMSTSHNILYLPGHITKIVKNPVNSWPCINKNEF